MRILLIDNYDSYTWNLVQLIWRLSGVRPEVVRNDESTVAELLNAGFTHAVISPGPGTPAAVEDFGICADFLRAVQVPCLGVCLGHQGLAWCLGGSVRQAPEIMHGRRSAISHDGTGIFSGIPQWFKAVRYHSLAVVDPVPAEMRVTARSESGVIMGLAHRSRPLHGVQFHPESVETEYGDRLITNFIELNAGSSGATGSKGGPGYRGARRARNDVEAPRIRVQVAPIGFEIDPARLFERAFGEEEYSFWLDSANNAYEMGQYSFMGAATTVARFFAGVNEVEEVSAKGVRRFRETIFEYLKRELDGMRAVGSERFPFVGGFIGYVGYGAKGANGIGRCGAGVKPDAELIRVDRFVVCDHQSGQLLLVTVGLSDAESFEWMTQIRSRGANQCAQENAGIEEPYFLADLDSDTYHQHFDQVQQWLRRGDSYEACYTYQIRVRSTTQPLSTYLRLRLLNPAPYGAYLRFGGRAILSSSPERFVRIANDGAVETKPIKGTCRRHKDPTADDQARASLKNDEKTRSENLMIVDLLRNDLGTICDMGTVHVPKLMAVESYATVHQLVTTIRGRLPPEASPVDCVQALFPGGSMTGAPKKRTVELLDALELQERGVYSGIIGYFSFDGQVDQSIIIRTIVCEDGVASIGVGGALTVMSTPQSEYEETRLKAKALLCALGIQDFS